MSVDIDEYSKSEYMTVLACQGKLPCSFPLSFRRYADQ